MNGNSLGLNSPQDNSRMQKEEYAYTENLIYNKLYNEEELKHSEFGIASFVMSVGQLLGYFFILVKLISTSSGSILNKSEAALMGTLIIFLMITNVVGLVLGIIGIVSKNRKKGFAITGVTINAIFLLFIVSIMIIGAVVK